ncbi:MAG TPA: YraN family protein [Aggregatilineaceae bacterium]|nr:YraN family protein [Aggregatilineaceae bacterium]
MTDHRRTLGQQGEDWVAASFSRAGYTILARNWRDPLGELDLVVRGPDEIVFVEVRTRRGPLPDAIAAALDSITPRKKARLIALAEAFRIAHQLDDLAWRVDVAAVSCDHRTFSMEVIHDAVDW